MRYCAMQLVLSTRQGMGRRSTISKSVSLDVTDKGPPDRRALLIQEPQMKRLRTRSNGKTACRFERKRAVFY